MFKSYLSALCLLLMSTVLSAQFTISGHVSIGNADGPPIPDWEVEIFDAATGEFLAQVGTDEAGAYSVSFDQTLAEGAAYLVQTPDICDFLLLTSEVVLTEDVAAYQVDFVLCEGIDPPPPPECEAHFYAEQVPNDEGFAVQFFDLSYPGEAGVISWSWNFGDGNGSTVQNPVHVYAEAGIYEAILTIASEDCVSTTVQLVIVYDEDDCDCPTDEYDPVCVFTPSGTVLEFVTACYAECAGYGPDSYVDCEGNECGCPDFYAPVCVVDADGNIITFQNHCFAECEGYGPDQWLECEDDCECTEEYDPVCVWTPFGGLIEFPNACFAECAGFEPGQYQDCDQDCVCPDYYDPICVTLDDGTVLTFQNICFAQCEGFGPEQWEACANDCDCPDVYDPVCVIGEDIFIPPFDNACLAECAGFGPDQYVSCDGNDCGCPEYYDPVCVLTPDGEVLTFSNPCFAECEGYGPDQFVECEDECGCEDSEGPEVCVASPFGVITFPTACYAECAGYGPETWLDECPDECLCEGVWDPVCVGGDFGLITFPNACYAECEGFGPEDFVDCEGDCGCDADFDPVCVTTPVGVVLTFSNACLAECAGYTPDQYEDCEDCGCDDYYFPVCVIDPATGEFIEFTNPCEAVCAGYSEEDIILCDVNEDCFADYSYLFSDDTGAGYTVIFTDESFAIDGITSWLWDFGDGNVSTEQNPVHTYAEAGVYDVILTVESPECGVMTVIYHLCVGEGGGVGGPECQAFFFFEQPDPDNLLHFQFIDFSLLGNATAWIWDFGDGNTATEQNPAHTYAEAGTYTVTLTTLSGDCESSVQIAVTAGENIWYGDLECRAWFLPIINPATLEVYFINLSSPDAVLFEWDFGDGNTSNDPIPLHAYAEAGTYTVSLTTTSADGCTNTFSVTLTFGEDDGGFTSNPTFSLISSTETAGALTDLTAYPNPTTERVQVRWETTSAGAYHWQLYNLNGQRLQDGSVNALGGTSTLEIDLSLLPDGIYLLRLQTPEGQRTLRLSKL